MAKGRKRRGKRPAKRRVRLSREQALRMVQARYDKRHARDMVVQLGVME